MYSSGRTAARDRGGTMVVHLVGTAGSREWCLLLLFSGADNGPAKERRNSPRAKPHVQSRRCDRMLWVGCITASFVQYTPLNNCNAAAYMRIVSLSTCRRFKMKGTVHEGWCSQTPSVSTTLALGRLLSITHARKTPPPEWTILLHSALDRQYCL